VYIGIEWKSGSPEAKKLLQFLNNEMLKDGKKQIRWDSGVGSSPFPLRERNGWCGGHQVCAGKQAQERDAGAQGQHPEVYEGAFRDWAMTWRAKSSARRPSRARKLDRGQPRQKCIAHGGANAAQIEPGLESATDAFKKTVYSEVKQTLDAIIRLTARTVEAEADDQRPHRGFRLSAGAVRPDEYSVLATST